MLDIATTAAAMVLLLYAVYGAVPIVPRRHPLQAIALNGMACSVGAIGAAPWVPGYLPDVSWPAQVLVVLLAVIATTWRREAVRLMRERFVEQS